VTDQPRDPDPVLAYEDLFEQLAALRTEVAQLRADFAEAKAEGAQQVEDLHDRIEVARKYAENLNERRVENIDQLTRKLGAMHDAIWAVRVDLEKKLEDVTRAMGRR